MFLLVPAYPGCPGSKAVKRSGFHDCSSLLSRVALISLVIIELKSASLKTFGLVQSLHSSSCIVVACCICGIVRLICKQIMSYCLCDKVKAGYIFISAKDSFCTLVTVDMMLIIVNLVAVRVSQKGHFVQSCLISCSLCRTVNSFMMLCI